MKKPEGYEQASIYADNIKPPKGGYVGMIIDAKEVIKNKKTMLHIRFDITEGDFENFYAKDFNAQNGDNKYWKGVLRFWIPAVAKMENEVKALSILRTNIHGVVSSNIGYEWDWMPESLKGKQVGIIFRDEEWEYDNKTGIRSVPYRFVDIKKIKNGQFIVPPTKLLKGSEKSYPSSNIDEGFHMEGFDEIDNLDVPC